MVCYRERKNMTDKKAESGKKTMREKPVKASTGAWWNSTAKNAVEETPAEEKTAAAPEKKKTAKPRKKPAARKSSAAAKKKATPKKKTAAKAKAGKKAQEQTEPEAPEQSTVAAETAPDGTGGEQVEAAADKDSLEKVDESAPRKKPSRPRGRSKQKAKTQSKEKQPREKKKEQGEKKKEKSEKRVSKEKAPVLKLLINAEEPEECRLALLADGRLESIHVSTVSSKQTKNNIYKARIVAIESNLQAAFVDYGTDKNGFLPFNEIHPEYYKQEISEENKRYIQQHQWKKLKIHEVLERGTELLVQVVKEEVGNKGANMTTYLSIPGRGVVLMPGSDSSGISRKISGEEKRTQLREIMDSLNIPEGVGWIVRTASMDVTKTALTKDVRFLSKLWREIKKKGQSLEGVGRVYQDHDCVLRFLREHFDPEIKEILVDDMAALEKVKDFLDLLPAKQRGAKARLHKGSRPIFNQFNVEDQIESIYQPQVQLPSGGSIVIDPTEALVAIDVNSGSTGKGKNFEESIFKANMEAATELARQLRLRDLGGLIVVDFIDMRINRNVREVERQVKSAMKRDRAKVDISRISKFGLMQISRQKLGAPIETSNYRVCEHCKGRGIVRSVETLALFYLRRIQTGASRKEVVRVECHFPLDVAQYLLNNKRHEISEMESRNKISIVIVADPALKPADHEIICHKQEKENKGIKQS